MKKLYNIIFGAIFFVVLYSTPAYCFMDWFSSGVSTISNAWNTLWGGAKNAFGWDAQKQSVASLVKNYQEASQFYAGIETFTKDPDAAMKGFYAQFSSEVTLPGKDLYNDVLNTSAEQKGYLSQAKEITFDYLKKNTDFSKAFQKKAEDHKTALDKIGKEGTVVDKDDRNGAYLKEIATIELENQMLFNKLLEIENKRLALQAIEEGKREEQAKKFLLDFELWKKNGMVVDGKLGIGGTGKFKVEPPK